MLDEANAILARAEIHRPALQRGRRRNLPNLVRHVLGGAVVEAEQLHLLAALGLKQAGAPALWNCNVLLETFSGSHWLVV